MKSFTISLKMDKYVLLADGPIWSKGRTVGGRPDPTPQDVEHDYSELFYLKNVRVEDTNGTVLTPIIRELAYANSGYAFTFSYTFWREGFAIENGGIVFVTKGEDGGWLQDKQTVVRKLSGGEGQSCSRAELDSFLDGTPEEADGDRTKELRRSLFDQYAHSIQAFQANGEVHLINEDDLQWDGSVLHVMPVEEIRW